MVNALDASSNGQRKSYREHINSMSKAYPESELYQGLQDFFSSPRASPKCWTRVTIFDSIEGNHRMRKPALDSSNLSHDLKARNEAISTRVVLVEYDSQDYVDRDIIDLLGSCYDIDPFIIYQHLVRGESFSLAERPSLRPPGIDGTWIEQGALRKPDAFYCFDCMVCYKAEDSVLDDVCTSIGLPDSFPHMVSFVLFPFI